MPASDRSPAERSRRFERGACRRLRGGDVAWRLWAWSWILRPAWPSARDVPAGDWAWLRRAIARVAFILVDALQATTAPNARLHGRRSADRFRTVSRAFRMRFFLAGIMQGSHLAATLHNQDYRERIKRLLAEHFPDADVYDPLADHTDSLNYDDDRGRERVLSSQPAVPRSRRRAGLRARGFDGHRHRDVGSPPARPGRDRHQPACATTGP